MKSTKRRSDAKPGASTASTRSVFSTLSNIYDEAFSENT